MLVLPQLATNKVKHKLKKSLQSAQSVLWFPEI